MMLFQTIRDQEEWKQQEETTIPIIFRQPIGNAIWRKGQKRRDDRGHRNKITRLMFRAAKCVTPDYRVEVRKRIKEEFNNGVQYYAMHGEQIHLLRLKQLRPSRESLAWHK